MPINWDKFQTDIDGLVSDAEGRTDAKLASRISSVTRLTDEEVKTLFPDPADVKKLAELMEIVKKAGDRDEKINKIEANIKQFGGIIVTLLGKFS